MTYLDHGVVTCRRILGCASQRVLFQSEVVDVNSAIGLFNTAENCQNLGIFVRIRGFLQQWNKATKQRSRSSLRFDLQKLYALICKPPSRIIMQRKLLINPFLSLVRPSSYDTLRQHQEVDFRQPLYQFRRRLPNILHQRDVALDELVLRVLARGLGQRREDLLRRGAVTADEDDVRAAVSVVRERLRHARADARGAADEDGDGAVG